MPVKPTEQEEEYLARLEFEKVKKAEQEWKKLLEKAERMRLKKIHYMRCPKCGIHLVEIDCRGIKIDRCTACDGVWLDAGELEMVSQLDETVIVNFFNAFLK